MEMEILESISLYYINKRKKSSVLSYKEEIYFQKLIDLQIPPSLIFTAIDNASYKYGNKINISNISKELRVISKERGLNIETVYP